MIDSMIAHRTHDNQYKTTSPTTSVGQFSISMMKINGQKERIGIGISSIKGHTKHASPYPFFSQVQDVGDDQASPRAMTFSLLHMHTKQRPDCSSHSATAVEKGGD